MAWFLVSMVMLMVMLMLMEVVMVMMHMPIIMGPCAKIGRQTQAGLPKGQIKASG